MAANSLTYAIIKTVAALVVCGHKDNSLSDTNYKELSFESDVRSYSSTQVVGYIYIYIKIVIFLT